MAATIAAFGEEPVHAQLLRGPGFVVVLLILALVYSEKWWHPEVWQQLNERSKEARIRDILLMRYIPDLREDGEAR